MGLTTYFRLMVRPGELVVVQRGIKFKVMRDPWARWQCLLSRHSTGWIARWSFSRL